MKKKKMFFFGMVVLCAACLAACHHQPIIIPDFNTPTEQYIFAKNLKDQSLLESPQKEKKVERTEVLILAYNKVTERFPEDLRVTPLAWSEVADIYFRKGDYKESLRLYEIVLKKYPDQDDVVCKSLFGAARCQDHLKNYEKALSYYKQCFERFENDKRPPLAFLGKQARQFYSRVRVR